MGSPSFRVVSGAIVSDDLERRIERFRMKREQKQRTEVEQHQSLEPMWHRHEEGEKQ